MSATATTKDEGIKVVTSKEAELLKTVDPNGVYTAILQIGEARRWRQFNGGKFVEVDRVAGSGRQGAQISYEMVPAVHEIGPYTGHLINGLIASHNKWVAANRDQSGPEGLINRMMLIHSIEPSDGLPMDDVNSRRGGAGSSQDAMVSRIVSATVKNVLEALGVSPNVQGSKSTSKG